MGKIKHKVSLGFAIGFLLLGLGNLLLIIYGCRIFHLKHALIGFVPGTILGVIWFVWSRWKLNEKVLIGLNTIFIPVFFLLLIGNSFMLAFREVTTSITDVSKYNKVLKTYKYPDNKEINHFPTIIPKNAKSVAFFETLPFLQGGNELHLAFQLPGEEIESLDKGEYNRKSKYIISDEDDKLLEGYGIDWSERDIYIPLVVSREIGLEYEQSKAKDYKIFIIDNKPYKEKDWNHGYSYGLVINKDTKRVVYWYERW